MLEFIAGNLEQQSISQVVIGIVAAGIVIACAVVALITLAASVWESRTFWKPEDTDTGWK